jgi:hypothetical protein
MEHDQNHREWLDKTMLNAVASKYHHIGMTGAQAIVAVWSDIANGKLPELTKELGIPEELGVIHAINTLSKELAIAGMIHTPKTADFILE